MSHIAATQQPAAAYDVIVIGGGASGLAASLSAASNGASVCVIERDVEAGLPILATGNGRCNISNARLSSYHYRHPEAFDAVAGPCPEDTLARFFSQLGLLIEAEDEGRLYPITGRADSVRDALLNATRRAGVTIRCGSQLTEVRYLKDGSQWEISLLEPLHKLHAKTGRDHKTQLRSLRRAFSEAALCKRIVRARSVIIATGGDSKAIASQFDLPCTQIAPVLCPIACSSAYPDLKLSSLDGLRVHGSLSLLRNGVSISFQSGEVLFRSYGISGIAAFNLSRLVQPDDRIELDLFPTLNEAGVLDMLHERERVLGAYTGEAQWLDGLLARSLSQQLCEHIGTSDDPLARIAGILHAFPLQVQGTAETKQAQVARGGIPLSACDLSTLSVTAALHPRLFACGEALDMDADCGGFNLAWAWLSGLRAGAASTL